MGTVSADLDTLEALYNTLKENVQKCDSIQKDTDSSLESAVWQSANADAFRNQWTEFKPKLVNFEQVFAAAATDVATNHNNIATANGEKERPVLAPLRRSPERPSRLNGSGTACAVPDPFSVPRLRLPLGYIQPRDI